MKNTTKSALIVIDMERGLRMETESVIGRKWCEHLF